MSGDSAIRPDGYAKPVVVPETLDDLRGPTTGMVELPRHLKWSGNPRYDLSQPGRLSDLYRTVLNEAASPQDLHSYLSRDPLIRLWPAMWLPRAVRRAWEERFPELRLVPHRAA
ncbi:hypothetical protein ACIA3K_12325 [Micromonospora sp. NPDC051543]|uniref:hypothetical protein n=1 Tax=Micromonospora sp. NPDC051543 TaxID=3364287 RepID=UPI0037A8CDC4